MYHLVTSIQLFRIFSNIRSLFLLLLLLLLLFFFSIQFIFLRFFVHILSYPLFLLSSSSSSYFLLLLLLILLLRLVFQRLCCKSRLSRETPWELDLERSPPARGGGRCGAGGRQGSVWAGGARLVDQTTCH